MSKKNEIAARILVILGLMSIAAVTGATVYEFGGHYYEPVLVPEGVTWDQANAVATRCNGHLATITSEAEDEFVYGLIDDPEYWYLTYAGPWLGGTDAGHEGTWTWMGGETWSYSNWWPSQPDNAGGAEHYLSYHGGPLNVGDPYGWAGQRRWNDARNDLPLLGYVIEWEDLAVPTDHSTWGGVKGLFR